MSKKRDVTLTIFITSISGSKTFTSLTERFFFFRRPPGLDLAGTLPTRIKDLTVFSAREVKRSKIKKRIPLQIDSEDHGIRQSHPNELSEN